MDKNGRNSSQSQEANQNNAFFASASNMAGTGDRSFPRGPDNGEQKQNMDIIKKLLEMFNLDDTMRKYETKNVVEYVLDPSDFGYDCSLSTTRVRQRLCDLMGTDVIRLNDKRYFQKLSQRLQEEYDGSMDKQEDARAAQENERLRRLMLEGVIDAPNDYRAVVHGESRPKPKKNKKRKIKRRIRIVEERSERGSEHTQTDTTPHSEDEAESTHASKEDVRTQVEVMTAAQEVRDSPDGQRERPPPKSIIKKTGQNKENDKLAQQMHARPPHHDHTIRSSSSCSIHRKSRRVKSAAPRLSRDRDNQSDDSTEEFDDRKYDTISLPDYNRTHSKYTKQEPEVIQRLRREQSVAGLYSIAEELVSPARADDASNRKLLEIWKKLGANNHGWKLLLGFESENKLGKKPF